MQKWKSNIWPAEFEDVLVVKSEIITLEPALEIKYRIYNKKTNDKMFEATTMQIAVDIETRKSVYNAPERMKKAIEGSVSWKKYYF